MLCAASSPLRCRLFSAPAPGPAIASRLLGRSCTLSAVYHQRSAATAAAQPPVTAKLAAAEMTVVQQAEAPAAGSAAPIEDRKLRILCLHGYLQNAEVGDLGIHF